MSSKVLMSINTENHETCPSIFHLPWPVYGIAGFSLIIKICLINLNLAEYTDGIIQLNLWHSPVVFFLPGYTVLVELLNVVTGDLLIAGRLVSILASSIALLYFYSLAYIISKNKNAAFWAALFLALSPIFNRWSLRVMTDSLFCLVFIIACRELAILWLNEKRSIAWMIFCTGIASLVRYQGVIFLPFLGLIIFKRRNTFSVGLNSKRLFALTISLIPWILLGLWIAFRGFGHHQQFIERGSYGFWLTLSAYYSMFETFVLYWPWAVSYGLFLLGCIGITAYSHSIQRNFYLFLAILALIFLLVQSAFLSFQYRYMLPLVPLWCICAGMGWQKCDEWLRTKQAKKLVLGIVVANLLIMTTAIIFLQRSTFGDIAESAKTLQVIGRNSRVLSDERYREGVYNVKMEFWSGREIIYLHNTQPQEGDFVVLHNTYSDLSPDSILVNHLRENFSVTKIKEWKSNTVWGDYSTLPLLPDIMVNPSSPPLTSNPPCMAFRFVPQHYYSIIVHLGKKQ